MLSSPTPPTSAHDERHLLALGALIYGGAALLWISPIATWAGTLSGLLCAIGALLLARQAAMAKVRTSTLVAAALTAMLCGLCVDPLLGGIRWPARLLGATLTIWLIDALSIGLITLGVVTALRSLAARYAAFRLCEASLIVASVVHLFLGHRDLHYGQPRSLSDWAFVNGYDPLITLMGVGAITLGAVLLVMQRKQERRKTVAVVVTLGTLLLLLGVVVWLWPGSVTLARQGGSSSEKEQEDPYPPPPNSRNDPIVAVVLLHEEYTPYGGTWYFRNNVGSQYNGKRLVRATSGESDRDVPTDYPAKTVRVADVPRPADLEKIVPTTVNILGEISRPPGLLDPIQMAPRDNPNPQLFRLSYAVESRVLVAPQVEEASSVLGDEPPAAPSPSEEPENPFEPAPPEPPAPPATDELEDTEADAEKKAASPDLYRYLLDRKAGNPKWSEARRRLYLEAPEDPRYRDLAREIYEEAVQGSSLPSEQLEGPMVKALALARWIEKNTVYSLQPGHSGLDDPAAEFLFGNRKGYCVHIAHSMVYLLRSLGVPARVGIGYAVPAERSGRGSSVTIKASDAHAWPEIYLDEVGWIVVDASPETIDPSTQLPQEPDQATMQFLTDKARQKPVPQPRPQNTVQRTLDNLAALLPWALAAAVVGAYGVKGWRLWAPWWSEPKALYRLAYRSALDRLSAVGVRRKFGETREEFAERIANWLPELRELTFAHLRRAVGQSEPCSRDEWLRMTTGVASRIRQSAKWHRQILGWINPVNWIWVK